MLPGMELMGCTNLAVPAEVMHHIVRVESSYNPYAIGVVGGRLARQPRNLPEAVATARMLESRGYNFSLGLAQVNRYNLRKYGIDTYERAFGTCPNLTAGASILAECHSRSKGDWGNAFSCYYSGNFVTGYRHGYVQRVFASMGSSRDPASSAAQPIDVLALGRSGQRPAVAGVAGPLRNALVTLRSGGSLSARSQPVTRADPMRADGQMPVAPAPQSGTATATQAGQRVASDQAEAVPGQAVLAGPVPAAAIEERAGTQSKEATDSAFVF